MAGKRKTHEPSCFSAELSSKPWPLTSATKIQLPCYSRNGPYTGIQVSSTQSATAGIACCSLGIQLLERFAQEDRIRVDQPARNQQIKFLRQISASNDFVAYIDALGTLDGTPCLLEWKTTASRYPEEPAGLLALDPQLVCYSWVTGIADVAQVVFVRKRLVEIQYFRTTITDEQRQEFGRLVENTVARIESAQFLPHSGIRFPQNPCTSCPYLGLCLGRPDLIETSLMRKPGDHLGWLDELPY